MKIKIIYKYTNKPTGGTNQFLKALKIFFEEKDIYIENNNKADIFLFISYKNINEIIKFKKKYPDKLFIHRIDGPVKLFSGTSSDKRDIITNNANKYIADATIFQTQWSKKKNKKLGLKKNKYEITIINAPNPKIFNKTNKVKFSKKRKTRIIATSWSKNLNKGFKIYKYLDENLDFSKYEMTFCGNSPFEFKNIKHIKPLPSNKLAEQLKQHDIYITASKNDPCSNSLIEAIHCGLPAVGLNSGGHPEIIGKGGLVFNKKEEIIECFNEIVNNYDTFCENINLPTMEQVGKKYYNFILKLYNLQEDKRYIPKKIKPNQALIIYLSVFKQKIVTYYNKIKNGFYKFKILPKKLIQKTTSRQTSK